MFKIWVQTKYDRVENGFILEEFNILNNNRYNVKDIYQISFKKPLN